MPPEGQFTHPMDLCATWKRQFPWFMYENVVGILMFRCHCCQKASKDSQWKKPRVFNREGDKCLLKTELVAHAKTAALKAAEERKVDGLQALWMRAAVTKIVLDLECRKIVGWASDGASSMVLTSRLTQEKLGVTWISIHCMCYHLNLGVSEDCWDSLPFSAGRGDYEDRSCTFNRSAIRRKRLTQSQHQMGKVLITRALMDVRWLRKLEALRALVQSRNVVV